MIANDWRVESVYGPFRMKEEASIGVLDCQIKVGDIKNFGGVSKSMLTLNEAIIDVKKG